MLTQLKIKNFALIENLEVDFSGGMTCITGETGAGKSILLGGLSLVLGKRADLSSLFDPTKKCVVEATFEVGDYGLQSLFKTHDLDYEDQTLLRRELLPQGKSRAFINDTPVTLNILEAVSIRLIDIHSQHDTQTLLRNEYQFQVLDALANNKAVLSRYQETLSIYKITQKEIHHWQAVQSESKDAFDLKQFLYEELLASNLETGMETALEEKLNALTHLEYLQTSLAEAIQLLEVESMGIVDQINHLQRLSQGIVDKANHYQQIYERVKSLAVETDDLLEEFKLQFDRLEANPQKLEQLQAQMDNLNSLYQKHKVQSVKELLTIQSELADTLEETINLDDKLAGLRKEQREAKTALEGFSKQLSEQRHKAKTILEEELQLLVGKMGMQDAQFKIDLSSSDDFLTNGTDILSFEFSANQGSAFKSLKKVASGGELSRIMLAIKTVLSRYKKLPTLVFDEIDSGVSGKISDSIAEVMASVAEKLQVFTITHLPQVAAKGSHHFKVEKKIDDGKTQTHLNVLNEDARIQEIAKMLSGNQVTETAIAHAKQLMN